MKKINLILIGLAFFFSCTNGEKSDEITTDIVNNPETVSSNNNSEGIAAIQFKQTDFNFGTIIEGEKVTHTYKFKNVGTKDLLLVSVKPS